MYDISKLQLIYWQVVCICILELIIKITLMFDADFYIVVNSLPKVVLGSLGGYLGECFEPVFCVNN